MHYIFFRRKIKVLETKIFYDEIVETLELKLSYNTSMSNLTIWRWSKYWYTRVSKFDILKVNYLLESNPFIKIIFICEYLWFLPFVWLDLSSPSSPSLFLIPRGETEIGCGFCKNFTFLLTYISWYVVL